MEAGAKEEDKVTSSAVSDVPETDVLVQAAEPSCPEVEPNESNSDVSMDSSDVVECDSLELSCNSDLIINNWETEDSSESSCDSSELEDSYGSEDTCEQSSLEESPTVPSPDEGVHMDEGVGFGNDLAVSAEHGLVPVTCLNLDPDAPWDALSNPASTDGTGVPFANLGVLINNFTTPDMIIQNPVSDYRDVEHGEHKDNIAELSLESLPSESGGSCPCSVVVLHGEEDSPSTRYILKSRNSDRSEVYANTLFIDMDEIGGLSDKQRPFLLSDVDLTEKPEVEETPEQEVGDGKEHVVYVCDEEDLQDVCRICFCGNDDQPLISPCKCTGSMQYIHHDCLMKWLQRTVRQSCELCQQEIPVIRKRRPITQWRLPHSRPTCFFWLLAFIVTLNLNIASIIRDASQQCVTNACIVFYIVEALGAILGFIFSCFFAVRSVKFVKLWMIHNEEWTFDFRNNSECSRIIKPHKPSKKTTDIQIPKL